jgi:hypothetical protein
MSAGRSTSSAKKAASKPPKPAVLSPTAAVKTSFGPIAAVGDGSLVVVDDGLRYVDASGAELAYARVALNRVPDYVLITGDVVFAWHRHGWPDSYVLGSLARRTASLWTPPVGAKLVLPSAAPAGPNQVLVYAHEGLFVVDEIGVATRVPVQVGYQQHLSRARAWQDGFLLELYTQGRGSETLFVAAADGALRWRVHGGRGTAQGEHALVFRDGRVDALDIHGTVVGGIGGVWPQPAHNGDGPFVIDGDDVFLSTDQRVVRCRPAASRVVWETTLPVPSLQLPALAAGVVAASPSPYASDRTVCLLDAQDGCIIHTENAAGAITALCAVDSADAVVACSFTKKLVGWRNILSSSAGPERVTLNHPDKVFHIASHASGALAAHSGDEIVFWTIAAPTSTPPTSISPKSGPTS